MGARSTRLGNLRRGAAALALAVAAGCGAAPDPRPNVLLLSIDTLRADHMSLYGYERETSPRIARWAESGTVYEHASAPCSWTLPSMSMLFTGQVRIKISGFIHPNQSSLAELLDERGYQTCGVFSNGLLDRANGFDRGFDSYEVFAPGSEELANEVWVAGEVNAKGKKWLEGVDGPFFLALHYSDPHSPYAPLDGPAFEPYDDPARRQAFHDALDPQHRELFDDEVYRGIEERIMLYDSEIAQVDRSIGELLDWLEARGLLENTLVVLTADHGEGLWQRAANPDEKLKGGYFPQLYYDHGVQLYDEQVRVPLVLAGPGVPAGQRIGTHVALLDVVPTVLSLLHLPVPDDLHGRPLPLSPDAASSVPVFTHCSRGTTVTVDNRWRLHKPRDYRLELGIPLELYDLQRDPRELDPIDDPARIAELEALIDAWIERYERLEERDIEPVDMAEQRRKLAAMGYVADELLDPHDEQPAPPAPGQPPDGD